MYNKIAGRHDVSTGNLRKIKNRYRKQLFLVLFLLFFFSFKVAHAETLQITQTTENGTYNCGSINCSQSFLTGSWADDYKITKVCMLADNSFTGTVCIGSDYTSNCTVNVLGTVSIAFNSGNERCGTFATPIEVDASTTYRLDVTTGGTRSINFYNGLPSGDVYADGGFYPNNSAYANADIYFKLYSTDDVCGDGYITGDEVCDDGSDNGLDIDYCNINCDKLLECESSFCPVLPNFPQELASSTAWNNNISVIAQKTQTFATSSDEVLSTTYSYYYSPAIDFIFVVIIIIMVLGTIIFILKIKKYIR
jgi:hypothetical protein